jgi:hypothetical protein
MLAHELNGILCGDAQIANKKGDQRRRRPVFAFQTINGHVIAAAQLTPHRFKGRVLRHLHISRTRMAPSDAPYRSSRHNVLSSCRDTVSISTPRVQRLPQKRNIDQLQKFMAEGKVGIAKPYLSKAAHATW